MGLPTPTPQVLLVPGRSGDSRKEEQWGKGIAQVSSGEAVRASIYYFSADLLGWQRSALGGEARSRLRAMFKKPERWL